MPDADHTGNRDQVAWFTPPLCASCRNASAPCAWICSLTRSRCGHARRIPHRRVVVHLVRGGGMHLRLTGDHGADAATRVLGEVAAVPLAVEARLAVGAARLGVHREVRAAHDAVARDDGSEASGENRRERSRRQTRTRSACERPEWLSRTSGLAAGFSSAPSSRPFLNSRCAEPRPLASFGSCEPPNNTRITSKHDQDVGTDDLGKNGIGHRILLPGSLSWYRRVRTGFLSVRSRIVIRMTGSASRPTGVPDALRLPRPDRARRGAAGP